MAAHHPFRPPVACGFAPSTTDLLRRADTDTLEFFDAADRAGLGVGACPGLVGAAFQVRVLDLWASAASAPTVASGRGVRHHAHQDGLPVVGGGR